jgi:signal peptidase I
MPDDAAARPAPPNQPWELLRFFLLLGLAAFVLRAFIFASFSIPTGSMLPRLMVGDYLFVSKWNYGYSRYSLPFHLPLIDGRMLASVPERGDVVVFKYPGPSKVDYVKRIIGLPGDTVQVRGGVLVLNGEAVPRTRIADWAMPVSPNSPCRRQGEDVRDLGTTCIYPRYRETLPSGKAYEVLDSGESRFDDTEVFVVPEGHLFAMGDNRDDSLDSRATVAERGVGFVPLDHVIGRAGIGFFSTDGTAELAKPWTWFSAARWDRIGSTY